MELEIIKSLQHIGSESLDFFCKAISYLASYLGFFFWLAVVAMFYKKRFAITFALTYGLSVGFNYILKLIVNRPRPYVIDAEIVNKLSAVGQSFPSGHTLSATIICFFLSYWIFDKVKNKYLKSILISVCGLFIITVAFSRMYLGQHYLSDTIAGFLLGACYSIIGIIMYRNFRSKKEQNNGNK